MNRKEKFVITINRELGSGGRTVGRLLAEELAVDFYDKAVVKALQEKYKLAVGEIEGLKGRSHSFWAELKRSIIGSEREAIANYYYVNSPVKAYPPTSEEMFKAETEILLEPPEYLYPGHNALSHQTRYEQAEFDRRRGSQDHCEGGPDA